MIGLSPKLSELLTRATRTPDLETALWKVLSEYIDLKLAALHEADAQLEKKWNMSFEEFSRRSKEGTLGRDQYSWEVEQDYWTWEETTTLLKHYEALKA